MFSDAAQSAVAAYDALDAALDQLERVPWEQLTTREQLNLLERHEKTRRRLPVAEHRALRLLADHAEPGEIGGSVPSVLADRLRITKGEAACRIKDAHLLGPRTSFTGEPLQPLWPATAAAQRAGEIGAGHLREIGTFFKQLPSWVDASTRERAERELAKLATEYRPDELHKLAVALADAINPDGIFSDEDRARRRGITLGRQDVGGMSEIRGWLTPEARAGLDAVLAKLAAPGMANPDDPTPVLDGEPDAGTARGDLRSQPQRNHDGLNAMCRAVLASGELGEHHGLPATIVVTTTLQELEAAAGKAHTGGGTWLPMSDVIRMATHAHHYLMVFDGHTQVPLYLGRSKRIASPGQRIVLHAKDRGCSFPGCTVPGYQCQVHHLTDWAKGGLTNADTQTLACGPHNRLATEEGWVTRQRADGTIEWIPPAHLDTGKPRTNNYWHPRLPQHDEDDEDDQ
jgi:hypothetical protein